MRWIMGLDPLSYGVSGLRRALYWGDSARLALPGWTICLGVSVIFAMAMFLCAGAIAQGRVAADLQ
jgi:ABC-type polysaccharide/polyol phosphate export permease